ncbi:MAG: ABC transporter ATP-binding protein [Lachnospiraceae bacterium]|nr:ABC transporter ATP-binding protein [Lachnospiraceae bacterium]
MEPKKVIEMCDICKNYYEGQENELKILHHINLTVNDGEFVALVGESGSGKSTMMNIMGALDRPSSGTYYLDGQNISTLKDEELSEIRNLHIGFVFQNFCMIPRVTALENVCVPLMYAGVGRAARKERAMELLEMMGMGERYSHKSNELSGGQNQRVAIARALANDPAIILADEPTGALDSKTGRLIMDIFHKLHKEQKKTIILITHSKELAAETQRQVTISDGRIISDVNSENYR